MGYVYGVVPVTEDVKICPAGGSSTVTVYGSRVVAYENYPTHVVSHRTKPEHPVLSPTGLSRALETNRQFAVMKRRTLVQPYSCPGGTVGTRETWSYSRSDVSLLAEPKNALTGWELGVRQALEANATNIAESVFELRKTAELTEKGVRKLYDWWQIYRGLRKGRLRPKPTDVAAAIVIPSFVVNPLLDQIGEASRVLNSALEEPIIRRVRWGTSDRQSSASTVGDITNGGTWNRRLNAVFYGKLRVSQQRITMGSPLELGWELLPFSWLADYFLGIGDWLCALDALRGYESVVGTVSLTKEYKGGNAYTASPTVIPLQAGSRRDRSYTRTAYFTVPFPVHPEWKPHATIRRLAIASSVLCLVASTSCNRFPATKRVLKRA